MLLETTSEESLIRGHARWPGETVCDGSAPVLSFRDLSGALSRCGQAVTKMRTLCGDSAAHRLGLSMDCDKHVWARTCISDNDRLRSSDILGGKLVVYVA